MKLNDKEAESKARSEAALQALHEENKRLGLYDDVYAVETLEQENRLLRARNERLEKRTWVGLTWEEIDECFKITPDQYLPAQIYKRIEAKLKEKNT